MFSSLKIKSMSLKDHDRGYGGYKYKVIVIIELDVKEFNKLPVTRRVKAGPYNKASTSRDLGSLVLTVNNTVYSLNSNVPAYNPSIDSTGERRAKNGVKTMEFVYFFNDSDKAEAMGMRRLGTDCFMPQGCYAGIQLPIA